MTQKKVLIVDDETSILEVLTIFLSAEGYIVYTAINGEEGIEIAKKHIPDIIILDVMMPKMSGYMVISLLKQNKMLKDIPVLLFTATAQIAGNITLENPAKYKISKPFKPEDLLNKIELILSENEFKEKTKSIC